MKIITLTGISKKGRERIKQHGDQWVVMEVRGPHMLVKSVNRFPDGDFRWVAVTGDLNFEIVKGA